jgi:arginyl-tRNA synthetase
VTGDFGLELISIALKKAASAVGASEEFDPEVTRPRDPEHGDWASNAALVLSKTLRIAPRELAERLQCLIDLDEAGIAGIEVAGPGFLNFRLDDAAIWSQVVEVLEANEDWGRVGESSGRRVNVEFVSANPTGPLHVAHGRGAAIGDAVASLLEQVGDQVTREFYVNDAGRQILLLGESVVARFEELQGRSFSIPEGGYHGGYVADVARSIGEAMGVEVLDALDREDRRKEIQGLAVEMLLEEQRCDLEAFGVHMDRFFPESSLDESGAIDNLLTLLKARELIYEEEGATWLRTSNFGDEKDRVLIKGDGSFTYFLPDLAYHLDKAERGFDLAIDVWGADHQGHEKRMAAALGALGKPNLLEVLIIQLVTVMRGEKEAPMSKRAGSFVALRDLLDKTGRDVARYFFLMRRAEVHLNFDLDLALDTSEANPVYKVQYAHARMCSAFRKGGVDEAKVPVDSDGLDLLSTDAERKVVLAIMRFPEVLVTAAKARAPHTVCAYLEETASLVNSWYHQGNLDPALRILVESPERTARIKLARAVQITLRNGLHVLGLTAPRSLSRVDA